jgi:hypothetical protein
LDPLAGLREAINKGEGTSLFMPDAGGKSPCPVEIGQVFVLRTCGIEITAKQRVRRDGRPQWRVDFLRIRRDNSKPYFLKRGGDYTHDPDLAMRSQDDLQAAATLVAVNPDERSDAHRNRGEPPEPERVDDFYQRLLSEEGRIKTAMQQAMQRQQREVGRQESRLAEVRARKMTRTTALVESHLNRLRGKALDEAA